MYIYFVGTYSSSESLSFSLLLLLSLELDLDRLLLLCLSLSLSLSLSPLLRLRTREGDHRPDRRSLDLDRILVLRGLRDRDRGPPRLNGERSR